MLYAKSLIVLCFSFSCKNKILFSPFTRCNAKFQVFHHRECNLQVFLLVPYSLNIDAVFAKEKFFCSLVASAFLSIGFMICQFTFAKCKIIFSNMWRISLYIFFNLSVWFFFSCWLSHIHFLESELIIYECLGKESLFNCSHLNH